MNYKDVTKDEAAELLGLSTRTFNRRLELPGSFTLSEISILTKNVQLSPEQLAELIK